MGVSWTQSEGGTCYLETTAMPGSGGSCWLPVGDEALPLGKCQEGMNLANSSLQGEVHHSKY